MRKSLLKICVGLAFVSATVFSGLAAPGLKTLPGHVPAAVSRLQPAGLLPGGHQSQSGHRPAVAEPGGACQPPAADLRPRQPELPSFPDAGTVHGPVWTHRAGLSKGGRFRAGQRIDGDPDARQPDVGGCERQSGGHRESLPCHAAHLPSPRRKSRLFRAGHRSDRGRNAAHPACQRLG